MIDAPHFIGGQWVAGTGAPFSSIDPSTGQTIWSGNAADAATVDAAVVAAQKAAPGWAALNVAAREKHLGDFAALLVKQTERLAQAISRDVGKPRWEATQEVQIMVMKLDHTIRAFRERCAGYTAANAGVRYRPLGVMAVLGPFNFPGHLPNGHIMPALLAGNPVIFKPSDKAPLVAQETVRIWEESGLPAGVLNLLQGGVETATALASHPGVNGLFFTGSSRAGLALSKIFAGTPERLLALEMGGNNALVVDAPSDLVAAALLAVQSAFQSAGQRCNCARRLLVTRRTASKFLDHLFEISRSLNIGVPEMTPEPFCGPLISTEAVEAFLRAQNDLKRLGGRVLLGGSALKPGTGFVSPAIFDVTGVEGLPDEETFGPLLTVRYVEDLDAAIRETNATRYGLAAGLISDDPAACEKFRREARAGVINCNLPLNAASSTVPFGGLGLSGNFRPSAYFAIDSCAYPVATLDAERAVLPGQLPAGINLQS